MTSRVLVFLSMALLIMFGCSTPSPEVGPPKAGKEAVARMIETHGGLEKWRLAPTVSFEDALQPADAPSPMVSRVTVEQGARRAYLDFHEMGARISWDGEKAWGENWQGPYPPRFLALLSFYFANLPWLAADPGVNLSEPGTGRLWDDPTEYITVKMSFEAGVGDTPDDYYILYIDPNSYRLRAADLAVTYAGILPPDVKAITEIIVYDEFATVDGLTVPVRASVYGHDHSPRASFAWRDWSFRKPFDESRMVMPSNAVLDTSSPARAADTPK
ncbi:MAG: hypothetical protein ACE5IP_05985 [Terriglobia bacterium]